MTANEAREKAESFNSIKNDIVYKKIQESIQDSASNGRYYVIIDFPSFVIESGNRVSYYIPVEKRLDKAVLALKNEGFKVTVRSSACLEHGYEVIVDWSIEEHN